jgi:hypothetical protein
MSDSRMISRCSPGPPLSTNGAQTSPRAAIPGGHPHRLVKRTYVCKMLAETVVNNGNRQCKLLGLESHNWKQVKYLVLLHIYYYYLPISLFTLLSISLQVCPSPAKLGSERTYERKCVVPACVREPPGACVCRDPENGKQVNRPYVRSVIAAIGSWSKCSPSALSERSISGASLSPRMGPIEVI